MFQLKMGSFLVIAGFFALLNPTDAACTFNLDTSSPKYPPHLVDTTGKIIQPTLKSGVRTITLAANQKLSVACEGSTLTATGAQYNAATCVSGTTLKVGTKNLGYIDLGCVAQPKESFIESGTCGTGGTQVQIGWKTTSTIFTNQITVCHVKSNANTLYSIDTIYGANIAADDKSNARPNFQRGNYFVGIDVETAYTQAQQLITIKNIVGNSTLASKYIDTSKSYFFSRGHLAPDGDFIDAASQDATYYYINVAPQWQSFNNGNWKELETDTRTLAITRNMDLVTYTGTYGVLTLADIKGVQQPIYLAKDVNNNNVIPAPKYFWKIVHDTVGNKATAFIGINNPHIRTVVGSDIFCTDVCSQVNNWANWSNRLDISKGYMFCCKVADFHSKVPYSPNLGNLSLLI